MEFKSFIFKFKLGNRFFYPDEYQSRSCQTDFNETKRN